MQLSFASGLFWVSVACCAIAQWFIIRSVWRSRGVQLREKQVLPFASLEGRRSAQDDKLRSDQDDKIPRSRDKLEVLWAVLPAIGLGVLLVYTWRAVMQ